MSSVHSGRVAALKPTLERLYTSFNAIDSAADPVQFVHRYDDPADREVVAFLAAGLAFGRVASVLASVEAVLATLGPCPAARIRELDPGRDAILFAPFVHRWTRGADIVALLLALQAMLTRAGSIEAFFVEGDDPTIPDVAAALESFSARALAFDFRPAYRPGVRRRVAYFFSRPSSGGACKRLNLFLRWMVRRDRVDPGGWTRVSRSRLIVPLDTHVIRVGRCLGLTRYRSPGWRMAADITSALRRLDAADPVKYDFSLCHLGMMDACGFGEPRGSDRCPLRGVCRPRAHRRQASHRPSGRP